MVDAAHPIHVVKRRGKRPSEPFHDHKLRSSIYAACLSVQTPDGEAASIANTVCDEVTGWCETKPEVTSHDLRRVAAKYLQRHQPDAAYLYEQQPAII